MSAYRDQAIEIAIDLYNDQRINEAVKAGDYVTVATLLASRETPLATLLADLIF